MGLQIFTHLIGKVTNQLVHQLAQHIRNIIRGVQYGQLLFRHAHTAHIVGVNLKGGFRGKVDHHESGKTAVKEHKAAKVRF